MRKATRRRKLMYGAAALVVLSGVVAAAVLTIGRGGAAPAAALADKGTLHGLPRSNLRVLTAAQTRRLLTYASSIEACLRAKGIATTGPTTQARAITLETQSAVGLRRLARLVLPCASMLGDPPPPSSLQVVDDQTIALTVPKQCLLDPKIEA